MGLICRRICQLWSLTRLIAARFCAAFIKDNDIWLISERGTEARDNGYAFYRWLKFNHPELHVKYVITKNSKDYSRISKDDVVEFNSFRHLLSIWKAKYLISTHIMGFTPDHAFYYNLDSKFKLLKNKKKVFLQHGITYNHIDALFCGKVDLDLFICGSNIEYNYIKDNFGFPDGIVQYTGLCRFDTLNTFESKRQILIMPTWRMYIDRDHFEDSDYYRAYQTLLCDETFADILERYNYNVVFYPHYEFQSKISSFIKLSFSNRITIADMTYDVQQLLKDSSLLITDFSSVFFDMMYMEKPIVFYQFDEEKYRTAHYKKGYLDYRDVGPVVNTLSDLFKSIEKVISNNCDINSYIKYYNETFVLHDASNCGRVYNSILQC